MSESDEDMLNGNSWDKAPLFKEALEAVDKVEKADTENGNSPLCETGEDVTEAHTSSFSFYDSSKLSHSNNDTSDSEALDSSLADFEDAALRYASLQMSRHNSTDYTIAATGSNQASIDEHKRSFLVQSSGWLPMETISDDPKVNSANVEACIQHLKRSQGQILDGVGAWGHGKDLLLTIDDEDDHLRLLEPLSHVELHSLNIKQIRVWGVGHDDNCDFAFVAKSDQRRYKCHVFRCENESGPHIAEQLHLASKRLRRRQKAKEEGKEEREKLAMSTPIPKPQLAAKHYSVVYLGCERVHRFTGMNVIKNVIRNVTTDDVALCVECVMSVSNAAVVVVRKDTDEPVVNCRIRCLSFMGLGDDYSLFGFISVVGNNGVCHVLQCHPTAFNLCLSVQEACCIRYRKAVDSSTHDKPDDVARTSVKPQTVAAQPLVSRRFSFRRLMSSVFSSHHDSSSTSSSLKRSLSVKQAPSNI